MSYRHTLEAALESLQDIEQLIKGFPDNGDVPSIELDLSLQKLRNIYELLLVLKSPVDIRKEEPSAAAVTQSPTVFTEPVSVTASAPPSAPVTAPPPIIQGDAVIEIEVEREITENVRSSEPAVAPPMQSTITHREGTEAQILSDRFKGRATLHETLHQSMGKEGQFHAQGKPVENLLSAIGINDRFTFIRELFNGDSPAFEHAIKALNEAANFNDAYNYMTQNYDWDMDSDAVQLLLDIIRRKYIISRHE